jgi:hypothetical protein
LYTKEERAPGVIFCEKDKNGIVNNNNTNTFFD